MEIPRISDTHNYLIDNVLDIPRNCDTPKRDSTSHNSAGKPTNANVSSCLKKAKTPTSCNLLQPTQVISPIINNYHDSVGCHYDKPLSDQTSTSFECVDLSNQNMNSVKHKSALILSGPTITL